MRAYPERDRQRLEQAAHERLEVVIGQYPHQLIVGSEGLDARLSLRRLPRVS